MPRWKTTDQIINSSKCGEFFDENWMNYESVWQYWPEPKKWNENRPIKFEDVDIWEVIVEVSGPIGIYAAWTPYDHYFIVVNNWNIIGEYYGIKGEKKLQEYMKKNNIPFSLKKIWVEENLMYESLSENKKIIVL